MNALLRKLVPVIGIVLLVVSACSGGGSTPTPAVAPTAVPPTATTAPTATTPPTNTPSPIVASGDACVVGVWTMSDMGAYMASIMQQVEGTTFELAGQEGDVRFTFAPDGALLFEADAFVVRFAIGTSGLSFELAVMMDGTGTAAYEAGAGSLTVSNSDLADMTFSGTLDGAELFSSSSGELGSLFGASGDESVTFPYTCSGDTLTYVPAAGVENVQPVVLTRVAP